MKPTEKTDWQKQYPLNTFGYDTTTYKELMEFIEGLFESVFDEIKTELFDDECRAKLTVLESINKIDEISHKYLNIKK